MIVVYLNDDRTIHSIGSDHIETIYVLHRTGKFYEPTTIIPLTWEQADKAQTMALECRSKQIRDTINHIESRQP